MNDQCLLRADCFQTKQTTHVFDACSASSVDGTWDPVRRRSKVGFLFSESIYYFVLCSNVILGRLFFSDVFFFRRRHAGDAPYHVTLVDGRPDPHGSHMVPRKTSLWISREVLGISRREEFGGGPNFVEAFLRKFDQHFTKPTRSIFT